jgi:succinate dehydrogenase/fumarate reductase flavoprotein subunit
MALRVKYLILAVIGGGLGGLAAAIALRRAGHLGGSTSSPIRS